ncbi:MAG: DUF898 family protein [Gammaproteobacteria bacterium]|nr:DUF898 family protein [Gammaproteobacteria bacterium]
MSQQSSLATRAEPATAATGHGWQQLHDELEQLDRQLPPTRTSRATPLAKVGEPRLTWLEWTLRHSLPRPSPLPASSRPPAPSVAAGRALPAAPSEAGVLPLPRTFSFAFYGEGWRYGQLWLTNLLLLLISGGLAWRWTRLRRNHYLLSMTELVATPALLASEPGWLAPVKAQLVALPQADAALPLTPFSRLLRRSLWRIALLLLIVGCLLPVSLPLAAVVAVSSALAIHALWQAGWRNLQLDNARIDGARLSCRLSSRALLRLHLRTLLLLLLSAGLAWPWLKMALLRQQIAAVRVTCLTPLA